MNWKYSKLGIWHIGTMCGVDKTRTASVEVFGSGEVSTGGFCMLSRFPRIGDKTMGHWSIDQLYCESLEAAKAIGEKWVQDGTILKEAPKKETMHYLDTDQLARLTKISEALHGMNDNARDQGHKLWLVLKEINEQNTVG